MYALVKNWIVSSFWKTYLEMMKSGTWNKNSRQGKGGCEPNLFQNTI